MGENPGMGQAPAGIDRTPPQDLAAEQSVLGAMLMSKDAIADVVEVVKGRDFYRPAHELIYDAMLDLYGRGEPVDPITVADELGKRGELERVGGALYLHDLLASVAVAANAGYYSEIVRDKAVLRRLVEASIKVSQLGYQGQGDVTDIVDAAQQAIYEVSEGKTSEDYTPLSQLIEPTIDEMEAIGNRGGMMSGVPTGFAELDELTNGLHSGQMIIIAARPAMGKALALDTPLPTPTGWTTMGEVKVGDELLDASGRATRVVAATEVMHERPCYRVTFSDGTQVIADAQHEWRADSRASRRQPASRGGLYPVAAVQRLGTLTANPDRLPSAPLPFEDLCDLAGNEFRSQLRSTLRGLGSSTRVPVVVSGPERSYVWHKPAYDPAPVLGQLWESVQTKDDRRVVHAPTVTTEEMAASVRVGDGRSNWSVPVAKALDLPVAPLPIDPYFLGVWLGDGHSAGARFTSADPEIADHLTNRGLVVRQQSGLNYGASLPASSGTTIQTLLREHGLLKNKHIPMAYLRASSAQRLDVLRGLLDTDGTVTNKGSVQLVLTNSRLADDAYELIVSLGMRCSRRIRAVKGRSQETSTAHILNFTAGAEVFGLARKQEALRLNARPSTSLSARYVTAVEPVASVPVRCVQVDNEEHLYLCTRSMIPTHNSTLALDFARAAAIKHHLTTAFFSLEMSKTEIVMRLLSAEAQVALNHIRGGKMTEEDWSRVVRKTAQVSEAPFYIDDSPNLTMMEIRAKARRLKQRNDLKLVIIDYMQLMTSGKKVESRQLEVSEFSRQIKLLAKELELPVIALSQLNRGPEQRTDKKPMLSDLRESGSLEQDADMVILLNREDVYDRDSSRAGEADLIVAKHRNGPTATIVTAFQGHYSRFVDMQH